VPKLARTGIRPASSGGMNLPTKPLSPPTQPASPVNPDPKAHPIHPVIPTQPIHEGFDPSTPITETDDIRHR